MIERPKRWDKGIFHRGELGQYMKVMSDEEAEVLFCLKQNKDVPVFVHVIAISSSLGEILRKNESKTVKIPVIQHKYCTQRNKKIRKLLSDTLKVGFLGISEKDQKLNNSQEDLQVDTKIINHNDYQKVVDGLLSKYGKDWEHLHKRNLDEAKDVSDD